MHPKHRKNVFANECIEGAAKNRFLCIRAMGNIGKPGLSHIVGLAVGECQVEDSIRIAFQQLFSSFSKS